jgi:hypothetical protein
MTQAHYNSIELAADESTKKGGTIRRHPMLSTGTYVKHGIEFEITKDRLEQMVVNFTSGKIGPKRPVVAGHPDQHWDHDKEPAVGWMLSSTADVSKYGDGYALFIDVDWNKKTEQQIKNKEFGYISPVFFSNWKDHNTGEDMGWSMRFAGITNDPHWLDQPELWAAFSASIHTDVATKANNNNRSNRMNLDQALEKVGSLTAENKALHGQVTSLKADLENSKTEGAAFSAKLKSSNEATELINTELKEAREKADKLESEKKTSAGDALIAKFTASGHIQEKHINNEAFKQMAYDEPEKFESIVAMFSATPPKSTPQGSPNDQTPVIDDPGEKALEMAKNYCQKNKDAKFEAAYFSAKKAIAENRTEIVL